MKYLNRERGYSPLEWIMYIALFAAISVFLINAILIMTRGYAQTRVNRELMESAQVSMERVTREIRTAESLDTGVSVFGSTPGTLRLNTTTSAGAAKTVQFALSSGGVVFTDNGTLSGNLTGEKVSVTSLIFRNITTSSGAAVRVEMTLQSLRPGAKTISVYDTVALRGAYE